MAKNKQASWSIAFLRIVLGIIFAYHGYMKLFVVGGLPKTVGFFASVGIPMANYAAVVVSFVEFFGGVALLLGIFTKISSMILMVNMAVAFFKVHLGNGFFLPNGYEFVLILFFALFVILRQGAGKLALARLIKFKWMQ